MATPPLVLLFLLFGLSAAREILVGGNTNAWKIPSSQSNSLNQWDEKSHFQIDDQLVEKYDREKDSDLQVSKEEYANCSTSNPTKEYNDGNTKVKLSGAKGHLKKAKSSLWLFSLRDTSTPVFLRHLLQWSSKVLLLLPLAAPQLCRVA